MPVRVAAGQARARSGPPRAARTPRDGPALFGEQRRSKEEGSDFIHLRDAPEGAWASTHSDPLVRSAEDGGRSRANASVRRPRAPLR